MPPLQLTFELVDALTASTDGCKRVAIAEAVQPLLSETVTVYVPEPTLFNVEDVEELDH